MQLKYEKGICMLVLEPLRRLTIATSAFLFLGRSLGASAATVWACGSSLHRDSIKNTPISLPKQRKMAASSGEHANSVKL